MDPQSLTQLFQDHFPVRSGRFTLSFVELYTEIDDPAATFRLIQWTEDGDSLENLKEQPVRICRADQLGDPRLPDAIAATAEAFRELAEQAPHTKIEVLMPSDLWFADQLLAMKRPQSVSDFVTAMMTKGRYGKLLP